MRRLALILIALPTVALAADAGGNPPAQAPTAQSQDANAGASRPPAAPAPPMTPAVAADSTDCRMSCAQANYFCRAANDESDCSPAWSRCVAACVSPGLDTGVSTAP